MTLRRIFTCLLMMLAVTSVCAVADSVTYYITVSNGSISPPASSYGSIALATSTQTPGGIDFTINMNPGYTIAGGGSAFGFNLGSGIILGNLSITNLTGGFSAGNSLGGGTMNGFGYFDVVINGPSASNGVSSLTFTVLNSNGGFSSVNQLVALSSSNGGTPQDGFMDFAAHVVPTGSNIQTGYAGANSTQVPEGGELSILFGSAFTVFGAMFLKRRFA